MDTGTQTHFRGLVAVPRQRGKHGQFDTVSCATDGSCWASGDLGRVAILQR